MELLKITLVLIVILMLTSCSTGTSTSNKLGYWENSYTKSVSFWQCVEPFTPYKNKDC